MGAAELADGAGAMLEAEGMEAGADEEVAVVAGPPQAVRLSSAAAATPATVKVVRFIDCISVLLGSADLAGCGQCACRLRPFPTWWAPAWAGVSLCIRALPRPGWVDCKEFFGSVRAWAESADPGSGVQQAPGRINAVPH
jgi:hypothetical protein